MMTVADHFEPGIVSDAPNACAVSDEQERRVEWWYRESRRTLGSSRDADPHLVRPPFSAGEQYSKPLLECLTEK